MPSACAANRSAHAVYSRHRPRAKCARPIRGAAQCRDTIGHAHVTVRRHVVAAVSHALYCATATRRQHARAASRSQRRTAKSAAPRRAPQRRDVCPFPLAPPSVHRLSPVAPYIPLPTFVLYLVLPTPAPTTFSIFRNPLLLPPRPNPPTYSPASYSFLVPHPTPEPVLPQSCALPFLRFFVAAVPPKRPRAHF